MDFEYVYKNYFKLISLKNGCNVLDIGCGPGNITHDHLLPKLPNTFKKLVGADLTSEMVNYAQKHYQTDPRINFQQLDVCADNVPDELKQTFDHVFSFYLLHLIVDQRKALKNIYALLKPGGNVTLTFMENFLSLEIYKTLANQAKWKPYLTGKMLAVPCHTRGTFKKLLTDIGFVPRVCERRRKIHIHDKETFLNVQTSINQFPIPTKLKSEFILEHFTVAERLNLVATDFGDEEFVHYPYTLFIANAMKPL